MKKLFAAAFLSLLGLGLGSGSASAWWCGCRPCGYVQGHQYNAFSDYCIDGTRFKRCNLCHKCCFLPVWHVPPPCCPPPCPAPCGDAAPCGPTGCCGELPPPGAVPPSGAPAAGAPAQGDQPGFKAPMPTPADGPRSMVPPAAMPAGPVGAVASPMPNLQPTGFRPMYYPGYYPAYGTALRPGMAPGY